MKDKKIKKITIICSGEDFNKDKLITACKDSDFIIAADGGMNILRKLKIKPELIIGDLDSINKKNITQEKKNNTFNIYPQDKNLTDSELAIEKAISLNPEIISIFSATGSYFDHSYANVINLLKYVSKKIKIELITRNAVIFPVINKLLILNSAGRRFSLFPAGEVQGLEISGSKYKFDKKNITPLDYSISNVIIKNKLIIKINKGMMFCIIFDEGYK